MMLPKPVYLDGVESGSTACTTRDAAVIAKAHGFALDPDSASSRTQHIGEGPAAFYVARTPGGYWPGRVL